MLIRERFWSTVYSFAGISIVGLGVVWENFFGPGFAGWGLIVAGLVLQRLAKPGGSWRTPLEWPLLLLALTALISLWATAAFDVSLVQLTRLGSGIVLFYSLVHWLRQRPDLVVLFATLTALGAILAAGAPFVVAWNETKGGFIPVSLYQYFPLLLADAVHPNIMATLMLLFFPLPLAYLLLHAPRPPLPTRLQWLLAAAACGLMMLVLFLTKSRGGYLAAAVVVVLVLWLMRRRAPALIAAVFFAAAAIWLLVSAGYQAPEVVQDVTDPHTWAFRQEVWGIALWMIADFPFTGVGMGTFNDVAARLYPLAATANPGAHNLLLQVGVDLGIFGLVGYLAILFSCLYMGLITMNRQEKKGDETGRAIVVGALSGLVGFMVHGLVDNTVWGTRMDFAPWLIIGLIVAAHAHARLELT